MTDVDVVVEGSQDLVVLVESSVDLSVSAEAASDVVVSVEAVQDVAASVEPGGDFLATVEAAQEVSAAVEAAADTSAEVEMTGLVGGDADKLAGVPLYPHPKDYIALSGTVEKAASGNGDSGDQAGDSTQWTATGSDLEIARTRIKAPAFMKRGVLEFHIVASIANPVGDGTGLETCVYKLQARSPRPTTRNVDATLFGLPQTWSTIATLTSKAIGQGASTGRLVLHARMAAEGVRDQAHAQTMDWEIKTTNLGTGVVDRADGIVTTALDPTLDIELRWLHAFSVAPAGDQRMRTLSYHAGLAIPNPRHPY